MGRPKTTEMTMAACAAVVIFISACSTTPTLENDAVAQHGHLCFTLNDSTTVRVPGQWTADTLSLSNAEETLVLTPLDGTKSTWSVPVFDGQVTLTNDTGHWRDFLRPGDYRVPVQWQAGDHADVVADWGNDTMSWALTFGEENPWNGQLFLQQAGSLCRGSIATATGDFRHLHGTLQDGQLTVQTFDGAHLFLFTAQVGEGGHLEQGIFYSGHHYHTPFRGVSTEPSTLALGEAPQAQWTGLPVQYSGVQPSGDSVHWSAADSEGVHVLSVMGSWCPNCMDEHRLILRLLDRFPELRVHTLAFERGLDREGGTAAALNRLQRYAQHMGLDQHADRWNVVLAGPASKTVAQETLPFLDQVVSFPTTVVIGPNPQEPWIHSGFNGPAMGPAHDAEVARFAAAFSGSSGSR